MNQITHEPPLGLTHAEAAKNLVQYGPNTLPEKAEETLFTLFLAQFKSPLVYLLLAVAGVTVLLRDYSDSIIILLVVLANAAIGTMQAHRSNNVVKSLRTLAKSKTKVIREGEMLEVSIDAVTIGDVVYLIAGDIVPADGELIESSHLKIDESKVNGESMPMTKDTENPSVFRSTVVVSGTGMYRVSSIGADTMIGKLSKEILDNVYNQTILEKKLEKLTSYILVFVLVSVGIIFFAGILRGVGILDIFKTSISLVVSAIPEGLPIVITVVLSVGAMRISKVKGLLKNLSSGATLATVSYICTDKTGTLTEGDIDTKEIIPLVEMSEVKLRSFLRHSIDIKNISGKITGDVLDIKMHAHIGGDVVWEELKELPFTSENKYNAKEYKTDGKVFQVYKGAPEIFIADHTVYAEYVSAGYRVLSVAYRELDESADFDVTNATPLALVIFEDKIRKDVPLAIAECKKTGLSIMMITGDNIVTANHVAKEVGILEHASDISMLGADLAKYSDRELSEMLPKLRVIARANPLDKLRIVRLLQERGEVVAMTGDGVNDGPSIALADIGIAMGRTGTEVAKEAADFILVNDSFSNIRDGIFEARTIVENIKKTLVFLFVTSVGGVCIIGTSVILGLPVALLPTQILWLNLITNGLLDISLAQEKSEKQYASEHYKRYQAALIGKFEFIRIMMLSLGLAVFGSYLYTHALSLYGVDAARTIVLVGVSTVLWFSVVSIRKNMNSLLTYNPFGNSLITGALVLEVLLLAGSIYTPIGNTLLHTVPLDVRIVLSVTIASLCLVLFIDEIYKYILRSRTKSIRQRHI